MFIMIPIILYIYDCAINVDKSNTITIKKSSSYINSGRESPRLQSLQEEGHEFLKLKNISAPKAEITKRMAQICCL